MYSYQAQKTFYLLSPCYRFDVPLTLIRTCISPLAVVHHNNLTKLNTTLDLLWPTSFAAIFTENIFGRFIKVF